MNLNIKRYYHNKHLLNYLKLNKKEKQKIKTFYAQKFLIDDETFEILENIKKKNERCANQFFENKNDIDYSVSIDDIAVTHSLKEKYLYFPIFWKNNTILYNFLCYNAYQTKFIWLKKKFNNIKYHQIINLIRDKTTKLKNKTPYFFKKYINFRLNTINKFLFIYRSFFLSIYVDLFYFIKFIKKKSLTFYYLILSFKKNKLFINLKNHLRKNFFFVSSGFFIKFFEKKKSFKKNKTIKLLMIKYLRKIFLISRIKNVILILKKTPVFLMELVNFFNSPIAHKFIDPVENRIIEENETNFIWIKFLYFIFLENKNFSKNKLPQKGRIKRKILRKVYFENKIVD